MQMHEQTGTVSTNLENQVAALALVKEIIKAGVKTTRGYHFNAFSFDQLVARRLELPLGRGLVPLLLVASPENADLLKETRLKKRVRDSYWDDIFGDAKANIYTVFTQGGHLTDLEIKQLRPGEMSISEAGPLMSKFKITSQNYAVNNLPGQLDYMGIFVYRGGFGAVTDLFTVTFPSTDLLLAMPQEKEGELLTQHDIDQKRQEIADRQQQVRESLIAAQEASLELWQKSPPEFFRKLWQNCGDHSGRETYQALEAKIMIQGLSAKAEVITAAWPELTDIVLITIANVDGDKLKAGAVGASRGEPSSLVLRYTRLSSGDIEARSFTRQKASSELVNEGVLSREGMAALMGLLKVEPVKAPRVKQSQKKKYHAQIGPRHHRY